METTPLQATTRDNFGKGAARKMRSSGRVPGLIYTAGSEPAHISVDPTELVAIFRRSGNPNTLLAIDVDGSTHTCLVKASQKHPLTRDLIHVDFYEVNPSEQVVVDVEVRPVGKAVGMTKGGKIRILSRSIRMSCLPANIPAFIEVDVTELDVNDVLRVDKVTPPEGCTLVYVQAYNVVSIVGRRTGGKAQGEG